MYEENRSEDKRKVNCFNNENAIKTMFQTQANPLERRANKSKGQELSRVMQFLLGNIAIDCERSKFVIVVSCLTVS